MKNTGKITLFQKSISFIIPFIALLLFTSNVFASGFSHVINLDSGWNIISTPRVLDSYEFSAEETTNNFDIYLLDATTVSGWATMAEFGHATFKPLYGYFINNKTETLQTLTFNYKNDLDPSERIFERTFNEPGWHSIGVANPTYAKTKYEDTNNINNVSNILDSLSGSHSTLIDFTDNDFSVSVSSNWNAVTPSDLNNLRDLRETKSYGVFITDSDALYNGFQNDDIPDVDEGDLLLSIMGNSPESHTYVVEENNRTNNQLLLSFEAKADGGNINLEEVIIYASSSTGSLVDMIHRVRLYMNGSVVGNVGPGATTLSFTGLDRVIANNATADFEVEVDFRRTSSTNYAPAQLIVGSLEVNAQNSNLEDVSKNVDINETHEIVKEGLTDSFVSKSTDTQSDGTVGKFTFVFNVTAYGDTFYISEDEAFSLGANGSHTTTPTVEGGGTVTGVIMSSNASLTSGAYRINEGQTRQFTVEVFVTVGADGVQRVTLPAIEYGSTTAATGTSLELGSPDYRSGGIHIHLTP